MLARRCLAQNIPRYTKFSFDIQESLLGRKTFTQRCLMPSLFGLKIYTSSSAIGILHNKKEYRFSCVCSQFCSNRNIFTRSEKEVSLRVKDKIPSGYNLIYKAPMDNYVKYGQWSSSLGIVCTVALSINEFYSYGLARMGDSSTAPLSYIEYIMLYLGLVSTITVLSIFLNSMTVRMYHNPLNDTYIAVFLNPLGLLSKVDFNKDQIEQLKSRLPLPWKKNLFSINGKTAILNEIHFRLPADYNALFKFDKDS